MREMGVVSLFLFFFSFFLVGSIMPWRWVAKDEGDVGGVTCGRQDEGAT